MRFSMLVSLLLSLVSFNSFASHLEYVCKTMVDGQRTNSPIFSQNFIARRLNGVFVIENFSGELLWETSERINALVEANNQLWVLKNYSLVELELTGTFKEEHPIVFNPAPNEPAARSMSLAKDNLIIARGSAGLSAFHIENRKLTWHSMLDGVQGSVPVDAVFDGVNLQVIMTGNQEGGFNGIATAQYEDGKVIGQTAYNQRRAGVIFPYAKAVWANNQLILNNGGWIHLITSKQLAEQKPIRPKWLAVEVGHDSRLHYMMLSGEFLVRENQVLGCGLYREQVGNQELPASRLFRVNL